MRRTDFLNCTFVDVPETRFEPNGVVLVPAKPHSCLQPTYTTARQSHGAPPHDRFRAVFSILQIAKMILGMGWGICRRGINVGMLRENNNNRSHVVWHIRSLFVAV